MMGTLFKLSYAENYDEQEDEFENADDLSNVLQKVEVTKNKINPENRAKSWGNDLFPQMRTRMFPVRGV